MKMRKIAAFSIAASMLLAMAGCSDTSDKNSDADEDKSKESIVIELEDSEEDDDSEENGFKTPDPGYAKDENYIARAEELKAILEQDMPLGYYRYYADGIPGSLDVFIEEDKIQFSYDPDYNCRINIDWMYKEDCEFRFKLMLAYSEQEPDSVVFQYPAAVSSNFDIGDFIFSFVDDYTSRGGTVPEGHPVQDDINILYSRIINMMNTLFNENGFTFAEFNFDFGSEYKSISPSTPLSVEFVPEYDEHTFADGVCTDCGLNWVQSVGNNVIHSDEDYDGGDWAATTFYDTKNKISVSDYTRFDYYTDVERLIFMYVGLDDDYHFDCDWIMAGDGTNIDMYFEFGGHAESVGQNVIDYFEETTVMVRVPYDDIRTFLADPMSYENVMVIENSDGEIINELPEDVEEKLITYLPFVVNFFNEDLASMGMSLNDLK